MQIWGKFVYGIQFERTFWFLQLDCKKLEPDRPEILHALEKTQKLSHRMLRWQTRKYQSMSGDVTGILWDYIAGITLHDVVAFYRIQKTLRACKKRRCNCIHLQEKSIWRLRSHPSGKVCRNGAVRHCRVMAQSVWRKSVILLWQMQSRMILSWKRCGTDRGKCIWQIDIYESGCHQCDSGTDDQYLCCKKYENACNTGDDLDGTSGWCAAGRELLHARN